MVFICVEFKQPGLRKFLNSEDLYSIISSIMIVTIVRLLMIRFRSWIGGDDIDIELQISMILNLLLITSGNGLRTRILLFRRCLPLDDRASYFEDPCHHQSAHPWRYSFGSKACPSGVGSSSCATSERLDLFCQWILHSLRQSTCYAQDCSIVRIIEVTQSSSDALFSTRSANLFLAPVVTPFSTRMKRHL